MKITPHQIHCLVQEVFRHWKNEGIVTFKQGEQRAFEEAVQNILKDYAKEKVLEKEVETMMDELERSHPGSFERYKMYPLLKKKLAKEKGIIL